MKKPKKDKPKYVDDGHTVYSMDGLDERFGKRGGGTDMTRKEKRAAIKAALAYYLPILLMTVACFALVGVALYLWLMY